MHQLDYGSFTEYFDLNDQSVYFSIHSEMYPAKDGIMLSGRYFVYCIHPERGSCHFIVEQDEHFNWLSEHHPPFIDQNAIAWLGERIEVTSKDL